MLNLVPVNVKCPICGKPLVNKDCLVDNVPSIKLNISVDDKKGFICLSSIYGSYNYSSNIEIPEGTIVKFYCFHCKHELISPLECEKCSAPMVRLNLIEGGKISFCSRSSCQKHSIEFEDLNAALIRFYDEFPYGGKKQISEKLKMSILEETLEYEHLQKQKDEKNEKEIIETGTFLHSFCPHCKRSLIEKNLEHKFKVVRQDGEEGFVMLSPYLNVFTHKSTIYLPEQITLKDVKCPHCDKSLMEKEKKCEKCGSQVVRILIAAMSRMVDFYICTKKGCTWHGLSDEDVQDIILEDSEEW